MSWDKHDICKAFASRQLAYKEIVFMRRNKSEREDTSQGVLIVILQDRSIVLVHAIDSLFDGVVVAIEGSLQQVLGVLDSGSKIFPIGITYSAFELTSDFVVRYGAGARTIVVTEVTEVCECSEGIVSILDIMDII